MSIDQLTVVTDAKDIATLQKVLDNIHNQAAGIATSSVTVSSVNDVPVGKILIADDGTTKQIYIRTGENNVITIPSLGGPLVIENRTSDPASPSTGQIWFRTDL